MRRVLTMQPGIAGMNLDVAPYLIEKNQSAWARDAIALDLLLRRIKGWEYDGDHVGVADALIGVFRARFAVADAVRTIVTADDFSKTIVSHQSSGAGISVGAGSAARIPRCMYRDELLLPAIDGNELLGRYSGAHAGIAFTGTPEVDQSVVRDVAGLTGDPGSFIGIALSDSATYQGAFIHARILSVNTTLDEATLEDLRLTAGALSGSFSDGMTLAYAFPCIPVYDAGTATVAANVATGKGTEWSTGAWGSVRAPEDALLINDGGQYRMRGTFNITDDDTISLLASQDIAEASYKVMRRMPVKDVAAHRGGLAATGVAQHPNAVYFSPAGWNLALPPRAVPPYDSAAEQVATDPAFFTLSAVEVPTPFDADPNVALLPAPQGLWVLKRKSAHMIYGAYPSFRQAPVGDGFGCIDIRSAWSFGGLRVWGGEEDVWADYGAQEPVGLTQARQGTGGINNEWRAIMAGYDFEGGTDFCTIGEVHGHLLVSVSSDGGADHVCFLHDLATGAWPAYITNHKARFFFSAKVEGEPERLLWVGEGTAPATIYDDRVFDSTGAIKGTGSAKNADGTAPSFGYHSGTGLGEAAGIDGEVLVGDVTLHANLYDAGAEGSSEVAVTVETAGGLRQGASVEAKVLDPILSDAVDQPDRHERRVNRSGRRVQIKVEDTTVGTDDAATELELAEIVMELFDAGVGT